jgi:undecaprenyl-diphosphatase
MRRKSLDIIISILWLILLIFTILVSFVDVKIYNETNTKIGLYSLNKMFLVNSINSNYINIISNGIFLICLLVIILMLLLITFEYFKTKKINKNNLNFIIHFLIMVLIWIIFDKILIINYRPILINGNIEGSYPSTHVMVSTFVLLFLSDKLKKIFKNDKIFYIISIGLIIIQSISRILLTMHWFTDIIGGLLIGCLLFFTFLRGEYGFNNNV